MHVRISFSQHSYIWAVTAPHPGCIAMNLELGPTFIQFVVTQELHTFINGKGVDWVGKAAVEVFDKIKEAGAHKEEWLRELREDKMFAGDDPKLRKAIGAYEVAHAQRPDIGSVQFKPMTDGAGERRHDVMLVSLE